MAYVPTGSNLNTAGNNGNFETDPSTWLMPTSAVGLFQLTRKHGQSARGIHSCQSQNKASAFASGSSNTGVLGYGNLGNNLYYLVRVSVKIPSATPAASDDAILQIVSSNGLNEKVSERVTKTVAEAKSGWVSLAAVFQNNQGAGSKNFLVKIVDAGGSSLIVDGLLYADNFTIYNANDNSPACTILVNSAGTIVTDETTPGANDGSIEIAVTGGIGPFEYTKDSGANWQSSNQFTGLSPGIYTIGAREQATPTCQAFSTKYVNSASPDHDFIMAITHETIAGAANGSINITVTGSGTAPFQFSKDGGLNFQGSNLFSGLAAGEYIIVVKDDNDLSVAKNAVINQGEVIFEKVYFSKNHITFTVPNQGNGTEENYRNYLEVHVQDELSGTFSKKMAMALELNADDVSIFYLRQALRGVFSASPPSHNESTIKRLTDRIKLFKVYYKYTEDDEQEPSSGLLESNPFLAVWGGLDKKKFPAVNYFGTYLPDNKKFMSWQPLVKLVDAEQEDYLQFWVYNLSIVQLKLMLKAYYDDGTDQTSNVKTATGIIYGGMYQVPVGPVNSGVLAIDPEKNLVKYDVWLRDQLDADVSEVRTYQLTPFQQPNTRYFAFLTSLGAYEVIRTNGLGEKTCEFEGEMVEKYLDADYSALDGQYQSSNKSKQFKSNVSSGFITGKYSDAWLEYMQDFLLSRQVYEITSGERVPVIIQARNMNLKKDRDNMRYIRFEVFEAYKDQCYTPEVI